MSGNRVCLSVPGFFRSDNLIYVCACANEFMLINILPIVGLHARSEPFQEVSGNHPTGHSASRGTVAIIVGLITLIVAGFMV